MENKDNKLRKIISYSLWGKDSKYTIGALKNIDNRDYYLPSWTCRFYIHKSVPDKIKNQILNRDNTEVIEKDENVGNNKMDRKGMFWRFEVLNEKDIERFIVRDTDSRISSRDAVCVYEWMKSDKSFHIIRDHPYHNTKIMGGMWGATKKFIDKINYNELLRKFSNLKYQNMFASDQEFLARMIYPIAKKEAFIHDNKDRFKEGARRIPHISVNGEFVGQPIDTKDNPI